MTVINMDCRTGMAALAENSIDAIVTDPPYGLSKQPNIREVLNHWLAGDDYTATGGGFMGKKWDSFVPGPLTWAEAYRALKPGGYIACFAGSRTVDLMSMSLRLGGFEVVDMCHWLYGTGFPKSMDISKAIDKQGALGSSRDRALKFTAWMRSTGVSPKDVKKATGSGMASHYLTDKSQPAVATWDMFAKMAHLLPTPPPEIIKLLDQRTIESENMKKRKVVGQQKGSKLAVAPGQDNDRGAKTLDVTEAHTDEAKKWAGWGTALKPAHEPIIIARKPLDGTYANNILKHGVGALNIDGCRVTGERFPGNVMHDGCLPEPMDRYFYSAKASLADREAGLEVMKLQSAASVTGRDEDSAGHNNPRSGMRGADRANIHPTVKPTELMRWLCRLITPPGGMVLDPFTGSGSTGRGAVLEGFEFIGFELSAEYAAIATARIEDARK